MWCTIAACTNLIFLLDLILHVVAYGISDIIKNKKILLLETCLQIMSFVALAFYLNIGNYRETLSAINIYNIIFLLRTLRLLYLLGELKQFQIIFEVLQAF